MKQFHKILFVSNGISEDIAALQEALILANDHKASLDILITCPPFNYQLSKYQISYEKFLLERMQQTLDTASKSVFKPINIPLKIDVEWGSTPNIHVIQQVLRAPYDLVIKEVEHNKATLGFKALDMSLLRKCPCDLFLHRPFHTNTAKHIAVAIDPEDKETAGYDLAIKLLKLAHALKMHYNAELSIISCWDFALENFLRNSVLIDISTKELDDIIIEETNKHYQLLHSLIQKADIKDPPQIHYRQGAPTELIPLFINEQKIDILVMGTVARTGVSGFIIGNTAENVLQQIACSLWAIKPDGFISPVKIS